MELFFYNSLSLYWAFPWAEFFNQSGLLFQNDDSRQLQFHEFELHFSVNHLVGVVGEDLLKCSLNS